MQTGEPSMISFVELWTYIYLPPKANRANVSDRFILNWYRLSLNLIIHQVLDIERKRNLSNENELLAHANNRVFFLSENNNRKNFIIISLRTTYVPRSPLADGSACLTRLIDELA